MTDQFVMQKSAAALALHAAVAQAAPIAGISIGRFDAPSSWSITFEANATDEQKAAARLSLEGFDMPAALAAAAAITVPFFYLKLELKARRVGDSNLFHVIDTFVRELGGDALFKWENAPNVDSTNELLVAIARQLGIADQVPDLFKAAQARIGNT